MNPKLFIRLVVFFVLIFVILFITFLLWQILLPFLFAYILNLALKPVVNILEQRRFPHTAAVVVVFAVFFIGLGGFLRIFVPAIINEFLQIQDNFPVYNKALLDKIALFETLFVGKFTGILSVFIEQGQEYHIKNIIGNYLKDFINNIPQIIINTLPIILFIVIIPFATFFFLLDEYRLKKSFICLVPNRYFEITLNLLHSLNIQFGWLLRGMLIDAIIMSIIISSGLWLIGLEYPILVGIFSGIANFIPYVGPIVGSVCAFLVALMTGAQNVVYLYIILVFILANLIENVVIQPLVLARAANLHPLAVIFLILLGSKCGGLFGMLLAVPVASLLQVTMKIILKELTRPVKPDFSKYRDMNEKTLESLESPS
ncbi:MAG TPA: AI-2E family transporter [Anaerolineae bacterium]|nr:AI-2E family transporter [Anaerolineae bacterium]